MQGGQLQQQNWLNDASQQWILTASGSNYIIRNKAGNVVIGDFEFSTSQGTGIILWTQTGGSNQLWSIR